MDVVEGRTLAPGTPRRVVDTEVVVVGTGAGGGVFAAELAEAGIDVVMLEEGGFYSTRDFTPDSGDMIKALYRNAGAMMTIGKPNVIFAEGRCVGGSTTVNAGICWRTPERILKRWHWEHGLDGIGADEMRPHFERVEQRIHVTLQDERTYGDDTRLLKKGAEKLGYRTMPVARNQRHCVGTNTCVLGCPTGAKQSVLVTYVPRALEAGARLFSDCRAVRVVHDKRRSTGVIAELLSSNGKKVADLEVRARHVVVAGGATQSPVLLKRSRIPDPHHQIGKNLLLHPNAKAIGIFDDPVMGWKGSVQGVQVTEFIEEGLMFGTTFVPPSLLAMSMPYWGAEVADKMKYVNHMVAAGVLVEDSDSTGSVRLGVGGEAYLSYTLGKRDFGHLLRGVALLSEMYFAAGARRVLLPFHNLKEITSPGEIRRIFDSALKRTDIEVFTVHAMGTARMGGDPRRSVVDAWGRIHSLANVYVSDASLFPSPIGVNPQVTIMALATRNARRFIEARRAA